MRQVLRAVAELEKALIRDRTAAAILHQRRVGKKFTRALFGWDYNKQGEAVENSDEQDTLNLLKSWRTAGVTFTEIARRLNAEGRSTKRGAAWSPQGVRIVFINHQRHLKLVA